MNNSMNFSLGELPGALVPDPGDPVMGLEEDSSLPNLTETEHEKFNSTNNLRIVSLAGKTSSVLTLTSWGVCKPGHIFANWQTLINAAKTCISPICP